LSNVYSLTNKLEEVKHYLRLIEESKLFKNNEEIQFFTALYTARMRFNEKDYEQTILMLDSIKIDSLNSAYIELKKEEINELLAESYQEIGNEEKASYHYQETIKVFTENDQLRMELDPKIMKAYDTAILQENIEILTTDSKKQQSKLYLVLVSLGILLISFFVLYTISQKKNKKKFNALMKQLNEKKEPAKSIVSENLKKKKTTKIEDDKIQELLLKLETFEKESQYLNRDSTLAIVAKKLNTNTSYLSKTINHHKGLTFTKYLTELRINYALNKLKNDAKFRSYTIKSIAQEVGFNSGEPFAKAFKAKTGIYPSYFLNTLYILF